MKVICDTNIWYRLSDDSSLKKKKDSVNLVLTFNTLNEFAQSYNIIKQPIYYKSVAKAIINYHNYKILHNPFHHLKFIDDDNWVPDIEIGLDLFNSVKMLATIPNKDIISYLKSNSEMLAKEIASSHSGLDEGSNYANNLLQQVKHNVTSLPKNEYRELDLSNEVKDLLSFMVKQNTESNLSESFDWSQIELFISVMEVYFKDLALQSNSKIAPNDWIDLFNLVYVNSDMQYWTKEKKWIRIIDESTKKSDYLYKP